MEGHVSPESNEFQSILETTEVFLLAGGRGTRLRIPGDRVLGKPKIMDNGLKYPY